MISTRRRGTCADVRMMALCVHVASMTSNLRLRRLVRNRSEKKKTYQNQDARRAGSALTDVRQRGSARAPGHERRAIAPHKGPLCASRQPARSAACTHQTHRLPPQQQEPACAHNTAAGSCLSITPAGCTGIYAGHDHHGAERRPKAPA